MLGRTRGLARLTRRRQPWLRVSSALRYSSLERIRRSADRSRANPSTEKSHAVCPTSPSETKDSGHVKECSARRVVNYQQLSMLRCRKKQPAKRGPGVFLAHEGLADEEGIHAACAHARDVIDGDDAALGDHYPPGRHSRQQIERGVEPRVEGFEIAVVDPDERRFQPE